MIVRNTDVVGCPYALGDVLVTSCPVSPAERWTGTVWQQIKDCFLLAAGDRYNAGSTGGEAEHTLTQGELPNVSVGVEVVFSGPSGSSVYSTTNAGTVGHPYNSADAGKTKPLGSGQAHNNMPPYKVYFMWERIK